MEDHTDFMQPTIKTESTFVNNGGFNGELKVDRAYISTPLRTPLQLFKASAAVTAGVVWVLAMVVFAHKSFDYIISLF